jgi:hypothetical protein
MATTPSGTAVTPRQSQRWGRTILRVGLSVMALLALTLALLPYVVSLDPVKARIITQIEAALQRHVDIGAIRLQLLSGLGVGIEGLTVYNAPGWQHPHLLKIDRLSVKLAWWSLLHRRLEVTKVSLHGGEIIVERDAAARLNIALSSPSVPASAVPSAPSEPSSPPPQAGPAGHPLAGLFVSEVTLQEVTITFVDHGVVPGQALTTTAHDVRLDLRDIAVGTPVAFALTATLFTDSPRNLRARGLVGPFPADASPPELPIEMQLQVADLLPSQLPPSWGVVVPLSQGRVGADIRLQGQVGKSVDIKGAFTMTDAKFRRTVGEGVLTPLPDLTTTYDLTLDLANERLQLTEAVLQLSTVQATMTGTVDHLLSTPEVDLRLLTNSFAPGVLLTDLPILAAVWPPPTTLGGSARLQARLNGHAQDARAEVQVDLREIALQSGTFNGGQLEGGGMRLETDDTHAMATLRVTHPRPPHVQLDVRAQRLVFDQQAAKRSVPAPPKDPAPHPAGNTPPAKSRPLPFTLTGEVNIAAGRIQGVDVQQLTADVALIDGTLTSKQRGQVYAGSYQGDIQLDLTQQEPPFTVNAKLLDIEVGQAIKALTPKHDALFGRLTSDLQASGQGLTWERLSHTLTGDATLRLSEAKLTAFDLMPTLLQVLQDVGGLAGIAVPAAWEHETFDAVEGDIHLRQGRVFSDAMKLRGSGLEAVLKGSVGLDQSLDYAGTAFLPRKLIGDRSPLLLLPRDDRGRPILPFAVQGTVQAPRLTVDGRSLGELVGETLIDKVKKQLGGTAPEEGQTPSAPPGGETGTQPTLQDLPRQILRDLFQR